MKPKFFKSYLQYFLLLIVALVAVSCDKEKDEPEPEPVSDPTPRTVLVYLLANNSLGDSGFDYKDLMEMEAAKGDLGRSRWVVYYEQNDGTIKLVELQSTGWKLLKTYENDIKSTSSERMSNVIRDTKAMAPAEKYGLVLWSHASGWVVDNKGEDVEPVALNDVMPLSFGDDRGSTMNVATLRRVLKDEGFDYIYTDCCNMATIEVVYELRDVARYFIGSALELPADGMPYNQNLRLLAAAEPDLIGAARNTYNYYVERNRTDDWCAISVIDLAEIEELASLTLGIYKSIPTYSSSFVPQKLDLNNPCRFYDFKQFVDFITEGTDLGYPWNQQLEKAVMYQATTPRFDRLTIKYHCGLATNIITPTNPAYFYGYDHTEWYREVAKYQPKPSSN
ncbi:MAG: hypothetical protein K2N08_09615 [Muribaculaceae bacterium]|nr:hypothetical protein [Muribaculaceae bacterium]